ncbi:hypothetical protein [Amnibacterium endophyticum]|uniref:DUF4190 domain-containing protein n=1 Tax=Amnibacterium endophyticum TaxID=2109337 RepID=A0ABW4LA99_9MICO
MTIEYFAEDQNLVFLPALTALLVATVLICLPIVFAPRLRRGSRTRLRGVGVVAGVLAAVALVAAGWQAGIGVRTLQAERASVADQLEQTYGLGLTSGEVGELVNGGEPQRVLPGLAERLDLRRPQEKHSFKLRLESGDEYGLTFGGEPVPRA